MILDFAKLVIASVRRRRLRSFLTMLGIFVGVAAIVSLVSVGQGIREAVALQFASLGTDRIIVQPKSATFGPPGEGAVALITVDDFDRVEDVPGVSRVAKRLIKSAKLSFNDRVEFSFVGSMPEESEGRQLVEDSFRLKILEGRKLRQGDGDVILVGNRYAGEDVFGKPVRVGSRVGVNDRLFQVVGILDKLGNPQFDSVVLMPEDAMRELYETPDELSAIVAQASQGTDPVLVAERIAKELRRFRDKEEGKEDFTVQTSGQLLGAFDNIIAVVTAVLVGIAVVSLVVGGIGIANTMFTSVLERTREIGVMKAIGARNGDIVALFTLEAGLLGLLGGSVGIGLGIAISKGVERLAIIFLGTNLVAANFPAILVLGSLAFSFLVGVLSGVIPAYRASRLNPVDALREE